MKKKIKTLLKKIFGTSELENEIKSHVAKSQRETLSMLALSGLSSQEQYIPWTGYSILPSTICYILNDIVINKRKNILEFGTGISTIFIARLLEKNGIDANFHSVESELSWHSNIQNILSKEGLEKKVNMIHAPLVNSPFEFASHKLWYDTSILDAILKKESFDLVIIDGPPGMYPYSRYGAIAYLKDRLDKCFCVLLDDTNRKDEDEIIREWGEMLNEIHIKKYSRFSVITKGNEFDSTPLSMNHNFT